MGLYGNYGFNHFNENKKFTNNTNHKSQYKKPNKIGKFFSNLLIITISIVMVCGTFGFIIFTDNKLGNDIRKKYDIDFQIGINKKNDNNTSNYQLVLENVDKEYNEHNINDEYYSDNSMIEKQQEIIDSGNIPTKKPVEITNDMTIITIDESGNVVQEIVQGERNPTPTPKNIIVVTTVPTIVSTPTNQPTPTQEINPNPTPIITPKPAIVTPIIIQPTTQPTQIITPIPEVVTPIVAQPTQPTIIEQETYTINQNAYNNAEQVANSYNDVTNAILVEINNVRINNGLNPVSMDNPTLNKMAAYRVYDMGENMYFSHDYNGISQIKVAMYAYDRLNIRHYENLGRCKNVEQNELATKVVKSWCESKGHYAVMIKENLTTVGIAIYKDINGTWYIATIYV